MRHALLDTTALPNLIPTAAERAMGRFMRAPDHDAGSGEGGGDAGASDDQGSADGAGDDASLLGGATADTGAGDGKGDNAGGDDAAGDKGAGDKADVAEGNKAESGPPETYELTLPEGVELDSALLEEATPVFKDLGLTNEAASKLVPLVGKLQERILTSQADEFAATTAQWARDAKADPEIGGANWKATEQNVARAMDQFIGPKTVKNEKGEEVPNGFRQLLDDTRLGNHPEMIRAFAKIGAAIGEDPNFARSGLASPEKKSREAVLYPNDIPKEGAK